MNSTGNHSFIAPPPMAAPAETKDMETDFGLDVAPIVSLKSSDGVIFNLSSKAAFLSGFIKASAENDASANLFDVPQVTSSVLAKVVEYLTYHESKPCGEIKKPLEYPEFAKNVQDYWDVEYTNIPNSLLFSVIEASNFMDIQPLLNLCCAKTASMIQGKTPEQIRAEFIIVNDFTPEEEAAVRAENKWAEP